MEFDPVLSLIEVDMILPFSSYMKHDIWILKPIFLFFTRKTVLRKTLFLVRVGKIPVGVHLDLT